MNQDYILYDGVSYVYNVSAEHRVEFTVTVTYDGGEKQKRQLRRFITKTFWNTRLSGSEAIDVLERFSLFSKRS